MQVGGILHDIIGNFQIWLIILLTTVTCVLPYVIYRRWEVMFYDDIINNLRHDKYEQDYNKKTYKKKIEAVTKYTRSIAKFRKIFNKQDDFEPENLADKKIKAVVDGFRSSKRKQKNIANINNPVASPFLDNNQIIDYNVNDNHNQFNNERINYRKYSNNDERERTESLENNNYLAAMKMKTRNSGSLNNNNNSQNYKIKNYSDKQNMNINLINNNNVNSNPTNHNNNNQGNIDPLTHNIGANGSQLFRYGEEGNAQNQMNNNNTADLPFKQISSSDTNNQNSSSNNNNYNYIHPYDEEDLINEHLGGKFKPITTTGIRRVLNPNESYERDFKIVTRENNKFDFNFNKFKNNNNIVNGNISSNNVNNFATNINTNIINSNGMNRVTNMISDEFINNNILNNDNFANKILNENNENENNNFDNFGSLDENENLNLKQQEQADDKYDLIVSANMRKTTDFFNPNDSKRRLLENEKIEIRSMSRNSDSKDNSSKNIPIIKAEIKGK